MNFQLLIKQWRVPRSTENKLSFFVVVFFTKAVPVQGITDIALLGFSLSLLTGMFISYNTIVYFFGKILFSNIYISVYLMFEYFYLSFG